MSFFAIGQYREISDALLGAVSFGTNRHETASHQPTRLFERV